MVTAGNKNGYLSPATKVILINRPAPGLLSGDQPAALLSARL